MAKIVENPVEEVAPEIPEELTSENQPSGIEAEILGHVPDKIHEPFDPEKIDDKTRGMVVDLLMKRIRENEIDLMPDFQRRAGIWDFRRKSQLIESLLLRIPLPVLYMSAWDDEKWAVVDGLQRLFTLKEFIINESFALEGLEFLSTFEGLRFSQLSRQMQRRINETEITVHVIQPGTPPTVMFNIFKRINTGGMPLSAQEIRHALFLGRSTTLLKELAESEGFKRATRNKIRDERMGDRECILRFCAFYLQDPNLYSGNDLDSFLAATMRQINKWDETQVDELTAKFQQAMEVAAEIFKIYAFRKYFGKRYRLLPINKALFEVWSVNFAKLASAELDALVTRRELLLERFASVMKSDGNFQQSISVTTGATSNVKIRFNTVAKLIREVLNADLSTAS